MKIKICGLREPENITKAAELKPDYMGFVFNKNSRRFIKNLSPQILSMIPPEIIKVGVFVNDNLENILTAIRKYGLDAVQLHGADNIELCRKIKEESKTTLIKVFPIMDRHNFNVMEEYEAVSDLFLFDTRTDVYSNNNLTFNWSILSDYKGDKDFILGGSIGMDDVNAIRKLNIPKMVGVNINSRFEIKPGIKNIPLIKQFMEEINKPLYHKNEKNEIKN